MRMLRRTRALFTIASLGAAGVTLPAHVGATPLPTLTEPEDVVDYTMTAKLDPVAHTIHGTSTIKWRNTSNVPVSEMWMHLYLNAFKNQRSAYLREPVGLARGTGRVRDWGYVDVHKLTMREGELGPVELLPSVELHRPDDDDETDARIPLPRAVAPNETITLDLEFDDKLPSVVERTGYDGTFHFAGQWFPKIARLEPDGMWAHFPFHHLAEFYADYGTYDVTVDVPEGYVVGATGPAVSSTNANGRHVERHVQGKVHDFAWTAWDRFQTIADTIDGVAVTVLYPPGFRVVAERDLATVRFGLPHYRQLYGEYPYAVLTVVHVPESAREAGAMEYPTLFSTEGPWYGPPGVLEPEIVTMHEFGHEYFYGLLASNEVAWPFLDEGLNSYAEEEAMRAWRGEASAVDLFGLSVSDSSAHAVYARDFDHDTVVAQPAPDFPSGSHYSRLVYSRTATIVETLRRVYGADAVDRAMGTYAQRFRFRHPTPDDFIGTFDEVVGKACADNLRAALFSKGWVDYVAISAVSDRAHEASGVYDRDGKREKIEGAAKSGYDGWVLVSRRGTLAFPVDVELTLADGTTRRVRWDATTDWARIPYRGDQPLRAAVVDPDHTVLLDEKLTNNHVLAAGQPHVSTSRSLERVSYWASLALQVLGP